MSGPVVHAFPSGAPLDESQFALLAGRVGGQTLNGGVDPTDELTLRGTADAARGFINLDSRVVIGDVHPATSSATILSWTQAYSQVTGGLGQDRALDLSPSVTINDIAYIWNTVRSSGTYTQSAAPNPFFSAFILFAAEPLLESDDVAFGTLSPVAMFAGPHIQVDGIGAQPATPFIHGIQFNPRLSALQAGDTVTATDICALEVNPYFTTGNATATAAFGTITGLRCENIVVFPFASNLGTETLANYFGLDFANQTLTASGTIAAVRSALTAGTGRYFLYDTGGAQSLLQGSLFLGATNPIELRWNGTGLRFDPPAAVSGQNFLMEFGTGTGSTLRMYHTGGVRFQASRYSMGVQPANPTDPYWFAVSPLERSTQLGQNAFSDLEVDGSIEQLTLFDDATRVESIYSVIPDMQGNANVIDDFSGIHVVGDDKNIDVTRQQTLWVEDGRARFDAVLNLGPASPSQITANQNDYAIPVGAAARCLLRLSTDASRTITGIVPEQDADLIVVVNVGSNDLVLAHENASSAAANRIISPTGANYTLGANESATLWHDATTSRWRILQGTGA